MGFDKNFLWGAASSSYQIEGAAYEDGKGLSVWDEFCKKPGAIWEQNTGDVACDHYHRYKEDVAIMKEIGVKAYRLSLSWPRILPAGVGQVNEKGVAFYDRLIDELLKNEIVPYITLYHWDYPLELHKRGGWLETESSNWFAEYAKIVTQRFSDRVANWLTLNEPQCFVGSGYLSGSDAPGEKLALSKLLTIAHNALLAHGKAVQAIRANCRKKCNVGFAPAGLVGVPDTDEPRDIAAARAGTFAIRKKDFWNNTWWMDPIYLGKYPEDGLALFGEDMPKFADDDMKIINQPLDFFGVNIYSGREARLGANGISEEAPRTPGYPITAMDWAMLPKSMYWGPKFFYERYKKPIFITENGMANIDWVFRDGKVHDVQRIDFLHRYLLELRRAIEDGVPVNGYFHWSIMDNFEWGHGYKKRFGLVHVDYGTQKRTLKDSAYWYKGLIATNGKSLDS